MLGAVVLASLYFCGLFEPRRLADGVPALWQIGGEMVPPDFTRWRAWLRPPLDTVAMSIGGTAIAVAPSLPPAALAPPPTAPAPPASPAPPPLLHPPPPLPEPLMGLLPPSSAR